MKHKTLTFIGWLVSIFLALVLASKIDASALASGLSKAVWQYLLLAALVNFAAIALKTFRWQILMGLRGASSFFSLFRATLIGFAGNNLLPARGGDIYKVVLISKESGVSKTALAGVTLLDKIFDGTSIVILFAAMSLFSEFPEWVKNGALAVAATVAVLFALAVILFVKGKKTSFIGCSSTFSKFFSRLGAGLDSLSNARSVILALAASAGACLAQIATIYLCMLAFNISSPAVLPALIFIAVNLAMMVPSAPANLGSFEFAVVLACSWAGIPAERALAIALMYHAVQFVPVTIAGFILHLRTLGAPKQSTIEIKELENSLR